MEAVKRFGWKDVKSIAQHVGTRTPTQVRTHAQKLFLRQQKESSGLMAPSKNGRSDIPPGLPMPESFGGSSSNADHQEVCAAASNAPYGVRRVACAARRALRGGVRCAAACAARRRARRGACACLLRVARDACARRARGMRGGRNSAGS